jgi:hypothetical protein
MPASCFGTPTKRQVSKRQVSKCLVSKRLKRQVYKTSGLQNVRFTKCQVYKTSGLQNVRLQKNIYIYVQYFWLVKIRRFCCSHVCRQSDGCVLFSTLEGCFAIYHHNHFSIRVIEDWNNIPADVKRVSNSESFKTIYRTQRATQMNHAAR